MKMKTVKDKYLVVGADFAGYPLKEAVCAHLRAKGWKITDLGVTADSDPDKDTDLMFHRVGLRKDGKTVRDYYYHNVSHQLGLDTHDICTERERTLRPGMVITVEPGLYVEEEAIGIRIENDVCITEEGCEDLSHNIPKTVEEIEALMAK
jgi:hypothetical protein